MFIDGAEAYLPLVEHPTRLAGGAAFEPREVVVEQRHEQFDLGVGAATAGNRSALPCG